MDSGTILLDFLTYNVLIFFPFFSCQGRSVGNAFNIESPEECLDACIETDGCVWATYFEGDEFCALTLDCNSVEICGDCTIASVDNNNCELEDENDGGKRNFIGKKGLQLCFSI